MAQNSKHFDNALAAVRALPTEIQDALAIELLGRVEDFAQAGLVPSQLAEVQRRLTTTPLYADDEAVTSFFAKHGVGG
jgi:hypothetical protein